MNKVRVNLTDFQKKKIAKAFKNGNNVKVRIQKSQLNGQDTLILDPDMMQKIDLVETTGVARDIRLSNNNMTAMKKGGFLQFLIPAAVGLVSSLVGGSGLTMKTSSGNGCSGTSGSGLRLRTGSGLYLKVDNKLYDVSDEPKYGRGFLSGLLKVLPMIAKKILPALGIGALTGAASEGASQVIKKIAGKKGSGLYLQHGGKMYDLTETKEGDGLLGKLLGLPGGKVPVVGDIPLLGALF